MSKTKRIVFSVTAGSFIILSCLVFYADMESSSVVPVLMYHSIDPHGDDMSPYVSPEIFKKQMEFLAKNGYKTITPDKLIAYIKKEERVPHNTIMITADDGYENFYTYAFPILKEYNLKATIFIVTDDIDKPGMLSWQELREISDSGLVTVASHTRSHSLMPSIAMDGNRLRDELAGSKKILEAGLGKSVDFMCYPNGDFNDLVKAAVERAGYKGAFTTNPQKRSDINDIYAIRRIKMSSSSVSQIIIWGKVSRFYAWYKERR